MNNQKNKNNPNRSFYIAIAVMAAIIVAIVAFFVYEAVSDKSDNSNTAYTDTTNSTSTDNTSNNAPVTFDKNAEIDKSDAKKVMFTMNDGQSFTMELYPKVAPVTVENFLNLVENTIREAMKSFWKANLIMFL